MLTVLWISATVAASAFQVARNAVQRGLMTTSGPWAATLVRFMFGLPFSYAFAVLAAGFTQGAKAHLSHAFWLYAMTGAVAQVLATACLLVAMRRAGFAVGTAMQQSSLPLAAVVGLVVFGDRLSAAAWAGVAVTTAGLLILSWPVRGAASPLTKQNPRWVSGGVFGVLAGLMFGYSLNAYRHAALGLDPAHPLFSAVSTVAITQTAQTLAISLLLIIWDRQALRSVFAAWRASLSAGLFGSLASCAWLLALTLAPAAQVRALGVVEAPMAAFAGRRLFLERLGLRQAAGGAATLAGVLMTALG